MEFVNYQLILDCVAVILTVLAFYVWNKWIKPWLYDHHLYEAAQIAVRSAQALLGRYNGTEKLDSALAYLKQKGYDINADEVISAVQAAWKKLDLAQKEAGQK